MTMRRPDPDFTPWLIYDKDGDWAGIRDDAPPEVKKSYEEFMKDEYDENGVLIQ